LCDNLRSSAISFPLFFPTQNDCHPERSAAEPKDLQLFFGISAMPVTISRQKFWVKARLRRLRKNSLHLKTKQSCHPDADSELAKGKRKDLLLHFIVSPLFGTTVLSQGTTFSRAEMPQ
jgi:hypothetical protein